MKTSGTVALGTFLLLALGGLTVGKRGALKALAQRMLGSAAVEQRLEKLSVAYETGKPYLLSRWRWPDRFNP